MRLTYLHSSQNLILFEKKFLFTLDSVLFNSSTIKAVTSAVMNVLVTDLAFSNKLVYSCELKATCQCVLRPLTELLKSIVSVSEQGTLMRGERISTSLLSKYAIEVLEPKFHYLHQLLRPLLMSHYL
jgi:hypothetical protein